MDVRQRATLLLGGLLSVSNFGCAAVNALVGVGDSVPGNRLDSAERMAAIARVFENQGRYDRAESLYHEAIRLSPGDPLIREQLEQLASRREVREFRADSTRAALAQADAVSNKPGIVRLWAEAPAPAYPPLEQVLMPARSESEAAEMASEMISEPMISDALAESQDLAEVADGETLTGPWQALSVSEALALSGETPSQDVDQTNTGVVPVNLEATEPDAGLWLKVLCDGSDLSTRILAASMLGDCGASNDEITDTLSEQLARATEDGLILAIADSQIVRGEATPHTADRLCEVALRGEPEQQIQSVTSLRSLCDSAAAAQCLSTLTELLKDESALVRAAAAVAMGDHAVSSPESLVFLTQLAAEDDNADVRLAARTALQRRPAGTSETASAVIMH